MLKRILEDPLLATLEGEGGRGVEVIEIYGMFNLK
jgi:hypothetical protein